jgi:hypothetical protein
MLNSELAYIPTCEYAMLADDDDGSDCNAECSRRCPSDSDAIAAAGLAGRHEQSRQLSPYLLAPLTDAALVRLQECAMAHEC